MNILEINEGATSLLVAYNGDGNPEYIGYPDPVRGGIADTGEPIWAIRKIAYSGDNVISIAWTRDNRGEVAYNSSWADRETETYV